MSDYERLKGEKKALSHEIMEARHRENQQLREKYPRWFKALDWLLIVTFVANLGAYLFTEALVVATMPEEPRVVEANPASAERQDLPTSDEAQSFYWKFMLQVLLISVFVGFMFWMRSFMTSVWGLWLYTALVCLFSGVLIFDFLRNAALMAGVLLR